jgi:hypothetical protein
MPTYKKRRVRWSDDEELRAALGTRPSEAVDDSGEELDFVRITRSMISWLQNAFRRTGTAVYGPDFTGNDRGAHSFDLQSQRTAVTQVASGDNSVAVGIKNTASAASAIAIGSNCEASAATAIAIGLDSIANCQGAIALGAAQAKNADTLAIGNSAVAEGDEDSIAIGYGAHVITGMATAIGPGAVARVDRTTNIAGMQIARRADETATVPAPGSFGDLGALALDYPSATIILLSSIIDLKSARDYLYTLPTGCKLFIRETGLILTELTALTTQPTIQFGIQADTNRHLDAFLCTQLTAAGKRETFLPLVDDTGEATLTFGITSAAAATTMKGRPYWVGSLVEDPA